MEKFSTINLSRKQKRRGNSFVNEEKLKSIDFISVISLVTFPTLQLNLPSLIPGKMMKRYEKFKMHNARRKMKKRRNTKRNPWRECEERRLFLPTLQMKKVVLTTRKMMTPNIIEVKLDRNQKKVIFHLSYSEKLVQFD